MLNVLTAPSPSWGIKPSIFADETRKFLMDAAFVIAAAIEDIVVINTATPIFWWQSRFI